MLPVFHVIGPQDWTPECSSMWFNRLCFVSADVHMLDRVMPEKRSTSIASRGKKKARKKGVFCNLNLLRGPDLGRARMSVDHFSIVDHYHWKASALRAIFAWRKTQLKLNEVCNVSSINLRAKAPSVHFFSMSHWPRFRQGGVCSTRDHADHICSLAHGGRIRGPGWLRTRLNKLNNI